MKLLSKNEIHQKKSLERKSEIDEGAKLARRIDGLRKTLADEELRLYTFRDESVKLVKSEIDSFVHEKTALCDEIHVLRLEREELRIPLDAEWTRIRVSSMELIGISNDLAQKTTLLDTQFREIHEREVQLKRDRMLLDQIEVSINDKNLKADECLKKAKKILEEAEKNKAEKYRDSELVREGLLDREALVAVREREVKIKDERLIQTEKDLNHKERFINDKYATLLRAEKQHGRNKPH